MDSKELYEQVRKNVKEWQKTKSVSLAASTMELLAEVLKEYE
jgi:hypothetical protein